MSNRLQAISEKEFQEYLVHMMLESAADAFNSGQKDDAIKDIKIILARFPDHLIASQLLAFYLSELETIKPNHLTTVEVNHQSETGKYTPIVLGIIFNRKEKRVLIGKRKKDKDIPALTWAFPGGRPRYGEPLENAIKRKIKEKTALNIKNANMVFAKTYPEKNDLISIYFACEYVGGKVNLGEDFDQFKWVEPQELPTYFTTSFHPTLKLLEPLRST